MSTIQETLRAAGAGFTDPIVSALAMYGDEATRRRAEALLQQSTQLNEQHPIAYNLGEAALGAATIPARFPVIGSAAFASLLDYLKSQGKASPQSLATSAVFGGTAALLPVLPGKIMQKMAKPATTAAEARLLTKAKKLGFKLTAGDFLGKHSGYGKLEELAIRSVGSGNVVEQQINQANQAVLRQRLATLLDATPDMLTSQGVTKVRQALLQQKADLLPEKTTVPKSLAKTLGLKKPELTRKQLQLILNNLSKATVSDNAAVADSAKNTIRMLKNAVFRSKPQKKEFDRLLAKISLTHALENSASPTGEINPVRFVQTAKRNLSRRQLSNIDKSMPDLLDVVETWPHRFEPTVEKSSVSAYMQTGGVGGAALGTTGYALGGPLGATIGTIGGMAAPAVAARKLAKTAVKGAEAAKLLTQGPSKTAVTTAKGLGTAIGSSAAPAGQSEGQASVEELFSESTSDQNIDYKKVEELFAD